MGYNKENLMPKEKILFSARVHPAVFLPAVVLFLACLIVVGYVLYYGSQGNEVDSFFAGLFFLLAAGLFFSSIYFAIEALITIFATEFAITNRRVVAKTGFIRRNTLEMLLPKIESVAVDQNILGRLLNFGTVTITGTGGTQESFKAIISPIAMRKKVNQIIEHFSKSQKKS